MPNPPFWPDGDEKAESENGAVAALARSALRSPDPRPQAEQEAREQALAQFQEMLPMPRGLHETAANPTWSGRVGRALRRLLGK